MGLSGPFLPSSDYPRKRLGSFKPVGLSGLEPPTSRLSGVRSNQLSYKPSYNSGSHLLSHTVSSAVPSAAWVLTIVFGMGTGVSPKRIATRNIQLSFFARAAFSLAQFHFASFRESQGSYASICFRGLP